MVTNRERDASIDLLKGIGIILMLLGHCGLPHYAKNFIFTFHMPLFFIISGILYKDRPIGEQVKKLYKSVLRPYFVTCLLIWIVKSIEGQPEWGISAFLGNGSRPVFNSISLKPYSVGPLWFLFAFFWGIIGFHLSLKIKNQTKRLIIAIITFEASIVFTHYIGLLPLDVFQGVAGCIFIWCGYVIQQRGIGLTVTSKWKYLIICCNICFVFCVLFGGLSMASHSYTLNVLQIIAAFGGSYLLILMVKKYTKGISSKLIWGGQFIGKQSLAAMCFHSIDWNLGVSSELVSLITTTVKGQYPLWSIGFFFEVLFIVVCFIVFEKIKILKFVYIK